MSWKGKGRATARVGAPVVVDGYAIPKRVTFTFEGENDVPGKGSPDLVAHFEVRSGVPQCVALHITAKPDGRRVRTSDLRLFNLEQLTENAFSIHAVKAGPAASLPLQRESALAAANAVQDLVEGRQPAPDALLREVARVYLNDRTGTPRVVVAQQLGMSNRTAARRIADARKKGLIPPRDADEQAKERAREALGQTQAAPARQAMTLDEAQKWRAGLRKPKKG